MLLMRGGAEPKTDVYGSMYGHGGKNSAKPPNGQRLCTLRERSPVRYRAATAPLRASRNAFYRLRIQNMLPTGGRPCRLGISSSGCRGRPSSGMVDT